MAAAKRGARRFHAALGFEVQEVTMARRLSQSRP
jgi:hypothetical protein